MDLQSMLDERGMTKYSLSKISNVPKTTIADICAGRSEIQKCNALTVLKLAKALDCSMEALMQLTKPEANPQDDLSYLECGLPPLLTEAIENMKKAWEKLDAGIEYIRWDCDFCELQADINIAETSNMISSEQAWYLREKYLRIERG